MIRAIALSLSIVVSLAGVAVAEPPAASHAAPTAKAGHKQHHKAKHAHAKKARKAKHSAHKHHGKVAK